MNSTNPDDYTNDELRLEVENGARLVTYPYCVSLLLITFRRRSRAYVIPAGKSAFVHGIPWALISLFFGWWGFPWGLIYTPIALFQTLGGGIDLTDEWRNAYDNALCAEEAARLAALSANTPPLLPGEQPLTATPPPAAPSHRLPETPTQQPTTFRDETPLAAHAAPTSPFVKLLRVGGVVAAVLLLLYLGLGYLAMSSPDTVTLVNGLGTPYEVTFNHETHTCPAATGKSKSATPFVHLKLKPGSYKIHADLPRGQTFESTLTIGADSIWKWPSKLNRVYIVNPDRLALVYLEKVTYRSRGASDNANEPNPTTFYPNQGILEIRKPDYYFTDTPDTLRIKKNQSATRTHFDLIRDATTEQALNLIRKNSTVENVAEYAARATLFLDTPALENLSNIIEQLKPEDAQKIFAAQLDATPINIQWHRYYQNYAERKLPATDIVADYRARLAKDPGNTTLQYLLGRILPDHTESRALYEKALAGTPPCTYAWNGLAYEAMRDGDRAKALQCLDNAIGDDKSPARQMERNALLIALGRTDEALANATTLAAAEPATLAPAIQRFLLMGRCQRPTSEVTRALLAYSSAAGKELEKGELTTHRAYLEASYAYGKGDETRAIELLSTIKTWPFVATTVALSKNDHIAAASSLEKRETNANSHDWFLASIVAHMNKDQSRADEYFSKARAALLTEGQDEKLLAQLLEKTSTATLAKVRVLTPLDTDRRIVCCVLALREADSEKRAAYLQETRDANSAPNFPRLLLERAVKSAATSETTQRPVEK